MMTQETTLSAFGELMFSWEEQTVHIATKQNMQ